MFRCECREVVYLAIDDNPAVVRSGVLVDLGDRDLGVGHVSNAVMAASSFCEIGNQCLRLAMFFKIASMLGNKDADLKEREMWSTPISTPPHFCFTVVFAEDTCFSASLFMPTRYTYYFIRSTSAIGYAC